MQDGAVEEESSEAVRRRSSDLVRPKSYPQKDRVQMIHLRSYLEKVGLRVEAKQAMVQKLREQLASCREKLAELEAEEAAVKASIGAENEAGHTAAVFRLRAQLHRVLMEREGESGLWRHLEETLQDAQ